MEDSDEKLIIRKKQMATLSARMTDEANRRLVTYARERFPDEFKHTDDPTLYELAKNVRMNANKYGVNKENDVATFLDFTVMYGEEFHQAPWAADILGCDALHGPDKMTLLRHRVTESGVNL